MAMDLNVFYTVEGLSRETANVVVSGLWQGLVLAAGISICLHLIPKTTAAVRFAVWTAVFAVLASLPLVHAFLLHGGGEASGHAAFVQVDQRWSLAIAALWFTVSLVRGVKLLASAVQLRRVWKRANPVEASLECQAALAAAQVRGVRLCTSAEVDRPGVIGFFAPRILIPNHVFERLTPAELEQIVLHEVGHLRRADDWINLLQKIGLVLVPLNPALMWIERRLCFERELACDDAVLQRTNAPKAYATCLTNLAEQRLGRRAAALSLGAWERRSELAQRVHRILRRGESMNKIQARLVLGVLLLGLIGGAAELSRSPQFVSFSNEAPLSAKTQTMPSANYQQVVFHPDTQFSPSGLAHETLLKASLPINRPGYTAQFPKRVVASSHQHVHTPVLLRSQYRAEVRPSQQVQRWVVLTTWEDPVRPRIVLTVSDERMFSSSFAAVPTEAGWLVIQL